MSEVIQMGLVGVSKSLQFGEDGPILTDRDLRDLKEIAEAHRAKKAEIREKFQDGAR